MPHRSPTPPSREPQGRRISTSSRCPRRSIRPSARILRALVAASRRGQRALEPGDVVVYESTVYPGATEEVCVPILEQVSGLAFNRDFFAGYSPRADQSRRQGRIVFPTIIKVTSGSTPEAADLVDAVYAKVITAGTHAPARSASPRPPRSSRTLSATSISR